MTVNPPLSIDTARANPNPTKVGHQVAFSCTHSGGVGPYTYDWDFGDGHRSADQNPKHAYAAFGIFSVQVTVTDSLGNTATCSKDIRVGLSAAPAPRAAATPPRPLNQSQMSLQYLSVNPEQATANQPVTITTNVVNTGDEAGNYSVVLMINGQTVETRTVNVSPHTAYPIRFTVYENQPGTYTVSLGEKKASFTVVGEGRTDGNSGGIIALVVLAILVVATSIVLTTAFHGRRA